ncbi:beta-1,3-galactosyltransferase 5-like [Centruroides vittatus]|uniref:beta-1,3-galactosyltransferase 5-like n=1 Tax=Centruroides vittatus TaxID=120091 RepID=UPI003510C6A3
MSRETKSRMPSRKCLKRMIVVVMSSSLAVGVIFTLNWNEETTWRRYSRSSHLPRRIFRELLSHRRPVPLTGNRSHYFPRIKWEADRGFEFSRNKILRNDLPKSARHSDEAEEMPAETEADGRWIVLPNNVTIHVGNVSNPHNYTYLFKPRRICQTFDPDHLKLLIYIESSALNMERRKAIRDTWGLLALQRALNFRIVFGLGLAGDPRALENISRESYRYDDILQENFSESFRNLALKSVMGLKWAVTHCPEADYFMKTDDDLLIHVPNLLKVLKKYSPEYRNIICHKNRVRRILRKELGERIPPAYGKYMVTDRDLPGQFFPPYCAGMGYVFPQQVAKDLYQAALVTPYFFIEDAYITGFCRQKAGVSLSDHPEITLKPAILTQQGSCAFREGRITSQEITHLQMREIWEEVNTQGYFCPEVIGYIS